MDVERLMDSEKLMDSDKPIGMVAMKIENKFKPKMVDLIFAIFAFVLGYFFARFVLFAWAGWGVTVFTFAYLASTTTYMIIKKAFVRKIETFFWLLVVALTGISYTLWNNNGFNIERSLFLFASAIYYILVATGTTLLKKTSNFIIIDAINSTLIFPLRNFFNQYVSFKALSNREGKGNFLPIFIGVITTIFLAIIIIPLLETADAGGFGMLLDVFRTTFTVDIGSSIAYLIVAVPVAAYIFGLISGSICKKGTDILTLEASEKTVKVLRIIHPTTLNIVLGAVCVIYLVFIFSQLPYFFSAFTGRRPEGWLLYSEFARQGFFELVTIASINLTILIICNIFSKKHRMESIMLKVFNIALAVITLVLIATAFSKMALYIAAYGLTMRRLTPCIFMIFLGLIFIALLALQKWNFSIVRFSLITGAIIFVAMSIANPDAMVVRYNANRYLAGTLSHFDTEILFRSGPAGVRPALDVLNYTENQQLRNNLTQLLEQRVFIGNTDITNHRVTVECARAESALNEAGIYFNISRPIPQPPTRNHHQNP